MLRSLIKIKEYDAHGGPVVKKMMPDTHEATPTRGGRFIIGEIEKHISYGKYALWSGVPWGAGLKIVNNIAYVDVKNNGIWKKLSDYSPAWKTHYDEESAMAQAIKDAWTALRFATYKRNSVELYSMSIPNKWLFNDFGHVAVKYFVDTNHDGILNGNERLLGDFIHTTPRDEAVTHYNKYAPATLPRFQVNLPESHGCIHVRPTDIDTMIGAGYLKKGQGVVVHSYADKVIPATLKPDRYFRGKFEAHFFPGLYKLAIYKLI